MLNKDILTLDYVKKELAKKYNLDFLNQLLAIPGADVYLFGGAIRDMLLEEDWKEADIRVILPASLIEREKILDQALSNIDIQEKISLESINLVIYRFLPAGSTTNCSIDLSVAPDLEINISDFSINSLYYNLGTGILLDRFNGIQDLKNHILRICKEVQVNGVFRAVKAVCKHNLTIEPETLNLLKANVEPSKDILSYVSVNRNGMLPELYQSDIFRGLKYNPYKYFQLFEELGLLKIFVGFLAGDRVSQLPINPFEENKSMGFEQAISVFLSAVARTINASAPSSEFLAMKEKLALDQPRQYTDFVVDIDKINYIE